MEISTDCGETGHNTHLLGEPIRNAWRLWEYDWKVPAKLGKAEAGPVNRRDCQLPIDESLTFANTKHLNAKRRDALISQKRRIRVKKFGRLFPDQPLEVAYGLVG